MQFSLLPLKLSTHRQTRVSQLTPLHQPVEIRVLGFKQRCKLFNMFFLNTNTNTYSSILSVQVRYTVILYVENKLMWRMCQLATTF